MKHFKVYKQFLNERQKQSRLAHGNLGRKYTQQGPEKDIKSFRKGQIVVYTGEENPDKRFMGKEGKITKQLDIYHVVVDINGSIYQMNKNDLSIKESINEGKDEEYLDRILGYLDSALKASQSTKQNADDWYGTALWSAIGPAHYKKITKDLGVFKDIESAARKKKDSKKIEAIINTIKKHTNESINEGLPSNIKDFAQERGVLPLVNQVNRWAKKLGKRVVGGTAIGKHHNTLILDLTYQGSEVRINTENDTIEVKDKDVKDFNSFKAALGESVNENKNIPNSIGIISNKAKRALEILSDKNIKAHPLNKNIKGFDVYDLGTPNNVILALTLLQKNKIKVLDTERLKESVNEGSGIYLYYDKLDLEEGFIEMWDNTLSQFWHNETRDYLAAMVEDQKKFTKKDFMWISKEMKKSIDNFLNNRLRKTQRVEK